MALPNYSPKTKLRILNSLWWRIQEAMEIGHEMEERQTDFDEFLTQSTPVRETHADRAMAYRALKRMGRL